MLLDQVLQPPLLQVLQLVLLQVQDDLGAAAQALACMEGKLGLIVVHTPGGRMTISATAMSAP